MADILITKLLLSLISFYKRFISPLKPKSCRYYPSCSEYAKWQFETNGFWMALFASTLRILRCNKLFPGGIEYPKIAFQTPKITPKAQFRYNEFKYFIVPQKDYFVVLKVLKK